MKFPYLRKFISKAKMKYKVFHINPDENYIGHRKIKEHYNSFTGQWLSYEGQVYPNEIWIKKPALDGLDEFLELI